MYMHINTTYICKELSNRPQYLIVGCNRYSMPMSNIVGCQRHYEATANRTEPNVCVLATVYMELLLYIETLSCAGKKMYADNQSIGGGGR